MAVLILAAKSNGGTCEQYLKDDNTLSHLATEESTQMPSLKNCKGLIREKLFG